MVSRGALLGIYLYQRWLSPRKGYRCAYSVLHGGTGCSGYAKAAIRERGLLAALPLVRARFRDCRVAFSEIRGEDEDKRDDSKRRKGWLYTDPTDCCDYMPTVSACRFGAPARRSGGCDINPCDGDGCNPCG